MLSTKDTEVNGDGAERKQMRLVCPNCDAQYEVDAEAIPEGGRDVQCSNCGNTWFQAPPDLEAEMAAEEALYNAAPTAPVAPTAVSDANPAKTSVLQEDAMDEAEEITDAPPAEKPPAELPPADVQVPDTPTQPEMAGDEPAAPVAGDVPPPLPPRRGLDESLMAVLREEADREAAVRRSETPRPLETQTDLGLEETAGGTSAAKAVRDRLSRLRTPDPEPEESFEKPTARRDLLPDIEEINSTLRASSENRGSEEINDAADPAAPISRSAFRSGFFLMLLIGVILAVAYAAAPQITEQFPATKSALQSYVSMVDSLRIWLDNAMRSAIGALQGLTGSAG